MLEEDKKNLIWIMICFLVLLAGGTGFHLYSATKKESEKDAVYRNLTENCRLIREDLTHTNGDGRPLQEWDCKGIRKTVYGRDLTGKK